MNLKEKFSGKKLFLNQKTRFSVSIPWNMDYFFGLFYLNTFLVGIILLLSNNIIEGQSARTIYYIPLQETNVHATLKTFTTAINRSIGNEVRSTISVVPTENGAVIYYDHWEDGYEADVENPVQSTTEVWGDGNVANGDVGSVCATCSGDLVDAGDVISLDNNVSLPRNPSQIKFDGRDKVASTKFLALSQSGYALTLGPVLAGCTNSGDTDGNCLYIGTTCGASLNTTSGSYTDAADLGDVCMDDAFISTATPDMAVKKILVTPSDSTAQIGDFIQLNIVVSNPIPTTLTTVDLTDTYDNAVNSILSMGTDQNQYGRSYHEWLKRPRLHPQ